jgi:predicted DNA-binding protein
MNKEDYELRINKAAKEQERTNFRDAYLQSTLHNPDSQPTRSKEEKRGVNYSIRLPSWVKSELTEISERENIPVSQLIHNAIVNGISMYHDQAEARKIFLEFVSELTSGSPHTTPFRISDFQRLIIRASNPLRAALMGEDDSDE